MAIRRIPSQIKENFPPKPSVKTIISVFLSLISISCDLNKLDDPGNIVPPAVDEDPYLPQLSISVSGQVRSVHLKHLVT